MESAEFGQQQGRFALRHRGARRVLTGVETGRRAASRICSTEGEVGQSRERQIILRPTPVVSGRVEYNKA